MPVLTPHGALRLERREDESRRSARGRFTPRGARRWRLVGRVHLNLAENRRDPDLPFAFMATYAASLDEHGYLRHAPLAQALRDFADDKRKLLELLEPVSHAAERLDWLKEIVDAGEIFHPLRWTPRDAKRFLESVETMESSGLVVRMSASWRVNRPSRPEVEATIGSNAPSRVGARQMLDFDMRVTLDGETLTAEEIESLLAATDGLALLRGKWVEIDRERLRTTLRRFEAVEKLAGAEGLNFAQSMRLVAGADIGAKAGAPSDAKWGHIDAGPWLAETLRLSRSTDRRRRRSGRWKAICRDCAGSIGSLVELLKGKISKNVMERICREDDGLFPAPREIEMSCSCPDGADMCKHVAAMLYGVGARLDAQPEPLFLLRGVDSAEPVSNADAAAAASRPEASERILAQDDVAALFGIDMSPASFEPAPSPRVAATKAAPVGTRKTAGPKMAASKAPESKSR